MTSSAARGLVMTASLINLSRSAMLNIPDCESFRFSLLLGFAQICPVECRVQAEILYPIRLATKYRIERTLVLGHGSHLADLAFEKFCGNLSDISSNLRSRCRVKERLAHVDGINRSAVI